ncbi:MAG: tRNA (guanosine(37)-N1)-methyltransferase TrmD [Bacteroidaceae bacterium]|jgi:tRNA (guanine37-N1)-methyltransferase|nr:tRNA (guanosine(37)-N1)-methyltransferase TrmD [Bacteroidaceae bacterium]
MRIDIITVLPELFGGFLTQSILGRAQAKGLVEIHVHNLRDYTKDKHKRVDDYPFGGGSGMIMQIQPIADCIAALQQNLKETTGEDYDEIIFTTPDGQQFDQPMANELSQLKNIIILCGHYKGIDQRIRDKIITREVSIGDFVLSGGELVAAMMTDAIVRVIPGAIGDSQAALDDCFQDELLAPPIYTRPASYPGFGDVPAVLLSGDPKKIREWELQQAMERTKKLRPDLLK